MTEKTEPQSASEPKPCSYCELEVGHLGDCPVPKDTEIASLCQSLSALQAERDEIWEKFNEGHAWGMGWKDRAESAESQLRVAREALEKIATFKATADNPFYAVRTIRAIKGIAADSLDRVGA